MSTDYIDVIKFPITRVSSRQVGEYILNLYENEDLKYIGFRIEDNKYVLYTWGYDPDVMRYFRCRTSGMVEVECMRMPSCKPRYIISNNVVTKIK